VNGGIVPELKSKWGVSLQLGRNYKLHKKPIANILQFYIDYQYIDLNLNFFEQDGNGLYDTSQRLPNDSKKFYIPWNLKKYEVNYGMALGPSFTVAPFNTMSSKGLHYLQFNMWYNIGYHASLLLMKNDEDADINEGGYSNEDKVREGIKMNLGHGLTSAFGFSLTWKFIGIGYEYRSASLKYQSLDKDTYGDDKYKFKSSTSRVFLQFRLK
jgi:hypothetical protein